MEIASETRAELEASEPAATYNEEDEDPLECFLRWGESKPEREGSDDESEGWDDLEWRLPDRNGVQLNADVITGMVTREYQWYFYPVERRRDRYFLNWASA